MPSAVIHIGTEKTGTSQIQRFLDMNRALLARNGIAYPSFLGQTNHTKLVVSFVGGHQDIHRQFGLVDAESTAKFRSELSGALDVALAQDSRRRWVFTSEHFSSRFKSQEPVDRFRDWMGRWFGEFEIIVYLRRQDFMAPSAYSTFVRSGGWRTWGMKDLAGPYFDLSAIVDRWIHAFGADNVTVRPYLEAGHRRIDLLDDFAATLGLPMRESWDRPSGHANERLSSAAVELLLMLNSHVHAGIGRPVVSRQQLTTRLAELAQGPAWQFPPDVMEQVAEHFRPANESLIRRVGAADTAWFEWLDQPVDSGRAEREPISVEKVAALMLQLGQERLLVAADDPQLRTIGARFDRARDRVVRRARRRLGDAD